mmetsp:Transcript_121343/g.288294  ORF Transcript_121343/g.288294 Transcript_121343/m.288294 type:complete len:320 (-) Transcript_121343:555-1514(-)
MRMAWSGMPSAQVGHGAHHIRTAVVRQTARDDLKSLAHRPVGVLAAALDGFGLLLQSSSQLHFHGTATRQEGRLQNDIASDTPGVMQVALDLVQHVPGGTTQNNGASFWILALCQEGEVFLPDLLDLEAAALGPHHRLLQLLCPVANMSPSDSSNSVVVSLPNSANHRHATLHQEVLCQIRHSLFCNHKVWLHLEDVVTHSSHLFLLLLQQLFPVGFLGDLDVGLTLALLVLQRAVQKHHSRIGDLSPHPWVCDVLVEHHAVQHLAIRQLAALDLLNLGVALHVNLLAAVWLDNADSLHCLDGKIRDQGAEPGGKLGVD